MKPRTRGDYAIVWIESFCLRSGKPIRLSVAETVALRKYYDQGERPPFDATLSACITLLHLCGIEHGNDAHDVDSDIFSMLSAAGPRLREVIKRDGEAVTCPELGTSYPRRAA
ncbi:hypothetical protein [Bradyrhizobium cenepequi]